MLLVSRYCLTTMDFLVSAITSFIVLPLTIRKRNTKRYFSTKNAFSDSYMVIWHAWFPIWNCWSHIPSATTKPHTFLCLKDCDDEMLALSLLSLRHVLFKIHEVRIRSYIRLTGAAETYSSYPRMKMKLLIEFPCFLYTYQNKFLQDLYWSFWAA